MRVEVSKSYRKLPNVAVGLGGRWKLRNRNSNRRKSTSDAHAETTKYTATTNGETSQATRRGGGDVNKLIVVVSCGGKIPSSTYQKVVLHGRSTALKLTNDDDASAEFIRQRLDVNHSDGNAGGHRCSGWIRTL